MYFRKCFTPQENGGGGGGRGGRRGDAANPDGGSGGGGSGGRGPPHGGGSRILWCVGKMFGCRESITHFDEENFYDAETQSISNFNRFAVKRASF